MKKKTIKKISCNWQPLGKKPEPTTNRIFSMREMQKEAFNQLVDKMFAILNAPTASGKSLAICWLTARYLKLYPDRLTIISVPQTIIGESFKGFYGLSFEDQNGNPVIDEVDTDWAPLHYLFDLNTDSNSSQIKSFLSNKRNSKDINDRVLVCSHASLVRAYQKHPELFKNINIVIDEAHRSKCTEVDGLQIYNKLGSIVSKALRKPELNINLLLSTATMFRGDKIEIVPQKYLDKFSTFHYPMDKYLADCHWLRSFSYDFAMYDKDWGGRLKDVLKENKKTIIYLPPVNSKYYSYGSKEEDLEKIYQAIAGKENYEMKEEANGLILIKKGNRWLKVVNLVEDSAIRDVRKQLVIDAHDHKDNSKIDIIIALNMFREGANWKWAERSVIIGTKGSLTDMVQILGRLFRDAEGKEHIEAIQLLPYSFDQSDKVKFKDNLNEFSKVIFATMLIQDAISPVKIELNHNSKDENSREGKTRKVETDYLSLIVQDRNKVLKIWEDIRNEAIAQQDFVGVDFNENNKETRKIFAEIVSGILSKHKIKEHHKDIAEYVRKRWMRESLQVSDSSLDLSKVDFDTVQINPMHFWLHYTSGMCGLDTMRNFRKAIVRTYYLPYIEAKENARAAVEKGWFNTIGGYQEWVRGNRKDLPSAPEGMPLDIERAYRGLK